MEDTHERSFLRLAAGFLAGLGIMLAALPYTPELNLDLAAVERAQASVPKAPAVKETPKVEEPPKVAAKEPEPVEEAPVEQAAAPQEVVVEPVRKPAAEPETPEPKTAEITFVPNRPQTIVEVHADPHTSELLIFERPNIDDTPPTELSRTQKIAAVSKSDKTPTIDTTAMPVPPARDAIADTLVTAVPALRPIDPPVVALPSAPEVQVDVVTGETAKTLPPRAPSAQEAPASTDTRVDVVVNSFGKKPPTANENAAGGLLASVTGSEASAPARKVVTSRSLITESTAPEAPGQDSDVPPPTPPIVTGPAFDAFAADFDDSSGKSLLGIILIDPGEDGMDRSFLQDLSFPVTYAIPADDPRGQFLDAEYRKKGFEILAMVPSLGETRIDRNTKAADVPTLLRLYRANVPGAIGLLDHPEGELHRNTRFFQALAQGLAQNGQAVLTNKQRINNSDRIAQATGIPFAKVLRPIDADGSVPSMRRALERAALTASKSGGAVVIGRSEPETIKTLYEWLLSNSARSVSVAPVSAVIRRLGQL